MVGAGADDANADAVLLVPSRVTVNDVDPIPRVEVVNSTLAVDLPDLFEAVSVMLGNSRWGVQM
jgi:hypothetical protein